MKITIIGPGAMGSLFAALLARAHKGHEIWLLDKDPERARKISSGGIALEGVSVFKQPVKAASDARQVGESDLVIIFTKSYDTESALRSIKPLLSDKTNVLSLQNGLGNLQLIEEAAGPERTIGGVTTYAATYLGIGKVKYAGKGETVIGKIDGRIFGDLRRVSTLFNEAGISTRVSKDISGVIWSKLIISVGINALASISRLPNGCLIEHDGIRDLLRQAVFEATKVAKRKKIRLIYDDPVQKVESVCRSTSGNVCSMLQDVLAGRRTEIDFINGAIIRQGKSCGVKIPVNDMLTQIVKSIESSYGSRVKI